MCFGAGDNQSGGFVVEVDGLIDAVKLVHLYGQVSCDVPNGRWSTLPEIWVKMADARAHWVVNGGEIV